MSHEIRLFDFAGPGETEELVRLREQRDAAAEEAQRLLRRAADLEQEDLAARRLAETAEKARKAAAVAAAVDGVELPIPQAPAVPAPNGDAASIVAEIRKRAEAKREEAGELHGRLRSGTVALASDCAQAAGEEYLRTAQRLGALHAAISAGQEIRAEAGQLPIVIRDDWDSIHVPNSEGLRALAHVGTVPGVKHFRLPVLGGDRDAVGRTAQAALSAAKSQLRAVLGAWPLDPRRG